MEYDRSDPTDSFSGYRYLSKFDFGFLRLFRINDPFGSKPLLSVILRPLVGGPLTPEPG